MTDPVAHQYDGEHYPTSLTTLAQMFNARARSAEQRAKFVTYTDDPAAAENAEAATWRHAEGLVRAHAYYLASRIRTGQQTADTIDADQDAALARVTEERDHLAGELNRLADFIVAELPHEIRGDEASAVGIAIRLLGPLANGKSAYVNREEFDHACQQIAAMHAAAVGEVRGPIRGVVEDVADLRAERDRLAAALLSLVQSADEYMLGAAELDDAGLGVARARFVRAIEATWKVTGAEVQPAPVPIDVPDEPAGDPEHLVDEQIDAAVNILADAFRPFLVSLWQGGLAVGRASAAARHELEQHQTAAAAPTTDGADR